MRDDKEKNDKEDLMSKYCQNNTNVIKLILLKTEFNEEVVKTTKKN